MIQIKSRCVALGRAGTVILRMLEGEGLRDHIIVVTRWFGGKHLGGDGFRHVQEAVRICIKGMHVWFLEGCYRL